MKTAFIGCGNMGSAIIGGLIGNGTAPEDITAADHAEAAAERAAEKFGIRTTTDNKTAVKDADCVLLAVKPLFLAEVMEDLRDAAAGKLIISIVAGKSLSVLGEGLGAAQRIVRVMPNTPALIGQGMSAFCCNGNVTEEDKEAVRKILGAFSRFEEVPERLMDVVTSVSGSSPAYVYMFIEALADAAVLDGMPRDAAYRFAAQTVRGSAQLVLESGMHPGALKDMVTSPGGTTIEGVRVLEENAFRGIVMEAVHACTEKSKAL